MPSNTPFTRQIPDLGTGDTAVTREAIDKAFKESYYSNTYQCLICSQPATYRLIPKLPHLNTAQIQDKGFVCEHCLKYSGHISPTDYGIRELK